MIDKVSLGDDVTLYCGDCLEILPTLESGSIDVLVTDPPYGIGYQSSYRAASHRTASEKFPKIANDRELFLSWIPEVTEKLSRDAIALVFCRWDVQEQFRSSLEGNGFCIKGQIIWDRVVHGFGDLEGQPAPQHDIVWFGTKRNLSFTEAVQNLLSEYLEYFQIPFYIQTKNLLIY